LLCVLHEVVLGLDDKELSNNFRSSKLDWRDQSQVDRSDERCPGIFRINRLDPVDQKLTVGRELVDLREVVVVVVAG
jgi:hypothetical protein